MNFIYDPHKGRDKQEPKRWRKFLPNNNNKEFMNINVSPVNFTMKEDTNKNVRMNHVRTKS